MSIGCSSKLDQLVSQLEKFDSAKHYLVHSKKEGVKVVKKGFQARFSRFFNPSAYKLNLVMRAIVKTAAVHDGGLKKVATVMFKGKTSAPHFARINCIAEAIRSVQKSSTNENRRKRFEEVRRFIHHLKKAEFQNLGNIATTGNLIKITNQLFPNATLQHVDLSCANDSKTFNRLAEQTLEKQIDRFFKLAARS